MAPVQGMPFSATLASHECPSDDFRKHSRFRHVFGRAARRQEWYDGGLGHAVTAAVNPKMIAVSIEVPAGGLVQVAKLDALGKYTVESLAKITDHTGLIVDLKWDKFNDNVLATASNDSTVKIWHIDDSLKVRHLRTLDAHSRRVCAIEWHNTVDSLLLTAGMDSQIVLWDVENDAILFRIEEVPSTSIDFSLSSSHFLATVRSGVSGGFTHVYDSRTGALKGSAPLAHDGMMHPRAVFVTDSLIVTTGNGKNNRRQLALYKLEGFAEFHLISLVDIDGSSGLLTPLVDPDLLLVYIAGKGDANIRFYEVCESPSSISYLGESHGTKSQTAVCAIPKRAVNTEECEIMRIYRVAAENLLIEPHSFIVPRRADTFQNDLYPRTKGAVAALTLKEWLYGMERPPVLIDLRSNPQITTCKPVEIRAVGDTVKLVKADRNNDRKFQFLAQVSKVDYREISERDDYEELKKIEEVRQKLVSSASDSNGNNLSDSRELSVENVTAEDVETSEALHTTVDESLKAPQGLAGEHAVQDSDHEHIVDISLSHFSEMGAAPLASADDEFDDDDLLKDPQKRSDVSRSRSPRKEERVVEEAASEPKPLAGLEPVKKTPPKKKVQKPLPGGRIELVKIESSPEVKPKVPKARTPRKKTTKKTVEKKRAVSEKSLSLGPPSVTATPPSTARSLQLLEEDTTSTISQDGQILMNVVCQLEKELAKSVHKCEQLAKIVDVQQQDIDSLRYEIGWKDSRIEFLQHELSKLQTIEAVVEATHHIHEGEQSDPEHMGID
uniref:Coronin n=1 Tax=Steinernema glaseri TaxID=37863 RepID=A0A1I7YRP4_9BILA